MTTNVNKPTNLAAKEADVNRKLQVYGIISAFQNGKVPSNDQIDVALNSFLASRGLSSPSNKLSTEGQALVRDFKDVVNQAKHLLLSKNEGNLLQDFIWQTSSFDPKGVSTPGAPVDKATAQQHGDKALEGLRTLGTLLITNGQFRKLLSDASTLLRDVAGDAASNAASKVRPSDEKLSQIDRPAADNTWHDAPDLSKDNLKNQASSFYKGNPKEDAKAIAGAGTSTAHPSGSDDPREAARLAAEDQANNTNSGVDARAGASAAKNTAKDRISNAIPDEHKETAQKKADEYKDRTREYLKTKMPEERRDQTIWRLKKMVIECQQHPDYNQAIGTLLDLAEQYAGHARNVTKDGTGTVQQTRSGLSGAENDLKTLIERFANGTSTDNLFNSINAVYKDADNDPELKDWFRSLDKYIRRALQEQGYILDDAATQDWNRLYDHGNYLLREKYRGHTDRILDEFKFLGTQFDADPANKRFAETVNKLFTDLGNDENGKPTFKPHLVKDLTDVILPAVFENISYIPVPRIEYSDPMIDAVIENLVLESDNFTPNLLEIQNQNHLRWGRKKVTGLSQHSFDVYVSGIQTDLRDVSYYVKRKQGFPSLTDTGVLDILLPGDGFGFRLKLSTADAKDTQNFFKVDKVDVQIKGMKIKIKKSNHKFLFTIAKSLALKVLQPAITKAVEKAIKDNFTKMDAKLKAVQVEANRAAEEAKSDPENAPNIYNRYATAAQKKFLQGKKKTEEATADKKVNVAVTKEDSIFPNIHLPGGISSKATEYRELARKGDKWESPVFSLGSASKSTNIPTAPKITTKSHNVTEPNFGTSAPSGTTGTNSGSGFAGTNPSYGGSNTGANQSYDGYNAGTNNQSYGGSNNNGYSGSQGGLNGAAQAVKNEINYNTSSTGAPASNY